MKRTLCLICLTAALAASATDFAFNTEKPLGGINIICGVNVELIYSPTQAGRVEYSAPYATAPLTIVQDLDGVASITTNVRELGSTTVKFYYSSPLHTLTITGTGDITADNLVTGADLLDITVKGTGNINIGTLKAQQLKLQNNGTGSISVKKLSATSVVNGNRGTGDIKVKYGYADAIDIKNSGTGYVEMKVTSVNAHVMNNGTGDVYLYGPTDRLICTNTGFGRVDVKGLSREREVYGNTKEIRIRK